MATWEAVMSGSSGRIYLVLQVDVASQNIPGNYSTLNWSVRLEERSSSTAYNLSHVYTGTATVSVPVWSQGGMDYDFRPQGAGGVYGLSSGTINVTHAANGTQVISVGAGFNGSGAYGSANVSSTWTLPTIPRASTPTFSANPSDIGSAVTINTNRADGSFTHNIFYNFENNGWSAAFATGVGDSTSWTPPLSFLDLIPNSASGNCQIWVDTYSGATLIGTTITNLTLRADSSIVPTIGAVTHSEATAGVAALIGGYVQSVSTLNLAITGAAGVHSSTVVGYKIEVSGQTINAASGVSAPVAASGTVNVVGTVTDSRGRTASLTVPITVSPYTAPVASVPVLRRADPGTGAVDLENGVAIRADLVVTVADVTVGGTQKNAITYSVFIRAKGATSWGTAVATVNVAAITYTGFGYWATYALDSSWEVRVEISDKFSMVPFEGVISVAEIFMHWGGVGQGMGIGKFWERGGVDVMAQIYQNNGKAVLDTSAIPPGVSWEYSGITAPSGWFLEDGATKSRTIYAALFAALSQTFAGATTTNTSTTVSGLSGMDANKHVGWGISATGIAGGVTIVSVTNATTVVISAAATTTATGTASVVIGPHGFPDVSNFYLPNHAGRVAIGVGIATGAADATNHPLGQKGGEEKHTLITNELPIHSHALPTEDGQPPRRNAGGGAGFLPGVTYQSYTDWTNSTGNSGGNWSHNTMPPFITKNYIIKY